MWDHKQHEEVAQVEALLVVWVHSVDSAQRLLSLMMLSTVKLFAGYIPSVMSGYIAVQEALANSSVWHNWKKAVRVVIGGGPCAC